MMEKDLKRMGRAELLDALNASIRDKNLLESQQADCLRRLEETKRQLEETEARMDTAQSALMVMREELAAQQERNSALDAQLSACLQQLDSARAQLLSAQEELSGERSLTASLKNELKEQCAAGEQMQEKIESLAQQLSDRVILKDNAGSLADAAIHINGVFAAAQSAADQYLENIERMYREQEKSCALMDAEAREKAAQMIRDAEAHCAALAEQTRLRCEALKNDAEKNVWQKWSSLSEQLKQISNEIHNTVHVSD